MLYSAAAGKRKNEGEARRSERGRRSSATELYLKRTSTYVHLTALALFLLERELIINTIPDGTKASAAGLSGCACVTRMRSGEKGEVWGKRRSSCYLGTCSYSYSLLTDLCACYALYPQAGSRSSCESKVPLILKCACEWLYF